jgi:hypothetical protein
VLADLAVPFVDTSAAALSWWLGAGPEPLARAVLTAAEGTVELQLLGASHRVVAHAGGAEIAEVVACGVTGGPLPPRHEERHGNTRYRLASSTTSYDERGLSRAARDLRRRWTPDPQALGGAFPGSPHALTVIVARPLARGWSWASWHVYPRSGEVVRTRSSLVRP